VPESIVRTQSIAALLALLVSLSAHAIGLCHGPAHGRHHAANPRTLHAHAAPEPAAGDHGGVGSGQSQSGGRMPFQSIDAQYRGG
jgi:hypothetical protein